MENEQIIKRVYFTKKVLNSLPIPEKGYMQYYDTGEHGLILRAYASGKKTFFLYRKLEGRPEYILLREKPPSRYPDMTPEQARRRAAELKGDIGAGKNPAEQRRSLKAEMKLGELFERFLTLYARKHKRPKSVTNDESIYRLHLSHWAARPISTITRREVQGLHNRIGKESGPYQANRTCALLHTLFEKALEWGYIGANPVFKLKKFPEPSRERFLQKEELPRFFRSVQMLPEMERDFFLIFLFTGARRANVLGMAWKDVNLDLGFWNIPAEQSKNKTAYTVPIIGHAMEILMRRRGEFPYAPWVFPFASKTGHLQEPKRAWARVLKAADLDGVRMHDLRRTLASWMAITGASEYIIKGALGHKTTGQSVTGIYARLSVDPIRAAMETAVQAMLRKGGLIEDGEYFVEFRESV